MISPPVRNKPKLADYQSRFSRLCRCAGLSHGKQRCKNASCSKLSIPMSSPVTTFPSTPLLKSTQIGIRSHQTCQTLKLKFKLAEVKKYLGCKYTRHTLRRRQNSISESPNQKKSISTHHPPCTSAISLILNLASLSNSNFMAYFQIPTTISASFLNGATNHYITPLPPSPLIFSLHLISLRSLRDWILHCLLKVLLHPLLSPLHLWQ